MISLRDIIHESINNCSSVQEGILSGIDVGGAIEASRMNAVLDYERTFASDKPLVNASRVIKNPKPPTVQGSTMDLGDRWTFNKDLNTWALFKETFPEIHKITSEKTGVNITCAWNKTREVTKGSFIEDIDADSITIENAILIDGLRLKGNIVQLGSRRLNDLYIETGWLRIGTTFRFPEISDCHIKTPRLLISGAGTWNDAEWFFKPFFEGIDIFELKDGTTRPLTLANILSTLRNVRRYNTRKIMVTPAHPLTILKNMGIETGNITIQNTDRKQITMVLYRGDLIFQCR